MVGNDLILTLANPLEAGKLVFRFKPGEYEFTRARQKRSLDANNMMWAFCEKIAQKVGKTKEEVYRDEIRQVSVYYPLPIKAEAVKEFSNIWQTHGLGWFVDVIDDSKLPGYKLCFAYSGSSTYDTAQMSRLIDTVLQDAEALDIETKPQEEIERLLREWKREKRQCEDILQKT